MMEVCITTYQRYYRLPEIIDQLNLQTFQDFRLNIWNNSGKDLTPFVEGFPKDRLTIINSEKNEGSAARFKLAAKTKGNPIMFLDDDEEIAENTLEYFYKEYRERGKDCILGWYTRTFHLEQYNPSMCEEMPYGSQVDYIGTGGMILDRWIFDKEKSLQDIPEPFDKAEDLYLCYIARMKYNLPLIKILPAVAIIVDGKDQYVGIDKEDIFKRLRVQGWWLMREMVLEKQAHRNLKDFKEVMDKHQIPFWISEGLLLGLYRDKTIIRGDEDDTDICYWKEYSDKIPAVLEDLKKRRFKILDNWEMDGTPEGTAVWRGGNKIDIIATRKNDKEVYFLARNLTGNMGKLPYFAYVFPKEIFDEFTTVNWGDLTLRAPKKTEDYLRVRYGEDWKTPKSRITNDYKPLDLRENPCLRIDWEYDKH